MESAIRSGNESRWGAANGLRRLLQLALIFLAISALVSALVVAYFTLTSASRPRAVDTSWFPRRKQPSAVTEHWLTLVDQAHSAVETADPDIIFIGDSITTNWEMRGEDLWERHYEPYGALNLGIPGDKTENVLWRLRERPLNVLDPQVVIIMLGANNVPVDSATETTAGIIAVAKLVRRQLPRTQILLLSVLPMSGPEIRLERVQAINGNLAAWARENRIVFLDISHLFLTNEGKLRWDLYTDGLHLTHEGLEVWADAMNPTLRGLLQRPPNPVRIPKTLQP